jgi:hypothetical protein
VNANRIAVVGRDFTGQLPVRNGTEAATEAVMKEKSKTKKRKLLEEKKDFWSQPTDL